MNEQYCCWAEKRLALVDNDKSIQGYSAGVFWERNSLNVQKKMEKSRRVTHKLLTVLAP
jgi:site-specific DNA-methyltransferase (adenine-specific)